MKWSWVLLVLRWRWKFPSVFWVGPTVSFTVFLCSYFVYVDISFNSAIALVASRCWKSDALVSINVFLSSLSGIVVEPSSFQGYGSRALCFCSSTRSISDPWAQISSSVIQPISSSWLRSTAPQWLLLVLLLWLQSTQSTQLLTPQQLLLVLLT